MEIKVPVKSVEVVLLVECGEGTNSERTEIQYEDFAGRARA